MAIILTAFVAMQHAVIQDPTPPMGWRSWNLYGSDVSNTQLRNEEVYTHINAFKNNEVVVLQIIST